jgi:DNA-binding CsgD family transcriptional regulator
MTQSTASRALEWEIGRDASERARAASEVGAAIAHELNGPLTALLLYVGDLSQNSDRFPAADGDGDSLKQVVENALREAERVCLLMQRIEEGFEAPLQKETAVRHGRDVIRWWSQASSMNGQGGEVPAALAVREPLTPRENEVLRLVIEGCSNKQGGVRMQISYRTFESHRAEVMRKLGAKNGANLVRMTLSENTVTS